MTILGPIYGFFQIFSTFFGKLLQNFLMFLQTSFIVFRIFPLFHQKNSKISPKTTSLSNFLIIAPINFSMIFFKIFLKLIQSYWTIPPKFPQEDPFPKIKKVFLETCTNDFKMFYEFFQNFCNS